MTARDDHPIMAMLEITTEPRLAASAIGAREALNDIERLRVELAAARTDAEKLTNAILDIDAHATPLGEDKDGFVTGGYAISVGCLHRALGLVGRCSAKCVDLPCERAAVAWAVSEAVLNEPFMDESMHSSLTHEARIHNAIFRRLRATVRAALTDQKEITT